MLKPVQVRQHINYMQAQGFGMDALLEGTNIDAARLSDPGYLVDVRACHRVVANVLRLSDDPHIGLHIGIATNLNDLGIVGYAMASASTLGQAIGLWLQYGNSPVGFPFTLRLVTDQTGGVWGVTAESNGLSGAVYRFYVEEILGMGMSFGQLLTGQAFQMQEIQFSYAAPADLENYQSLFGCPIIFDAPRTRALVARPSLDTPVKSNDSEMRELCIRHCSQLVRQIGRHGPVSSRLRSALTTLGSIPSLDEAAEALSLSPRSLRRHLKAEGTSFQQVLDEFRSDLAQEYLGSGLMPAKEVAFLLGFSHVETFRRAFKVWTGQSIGSYITSER